MSRIIKFRAWDRKLKRWLTPSELAEDLGDWFVYNPEVPEAVGVDVMQFTGLLDKNSKEIYEGDILNYSYNQGESSHLHMIAFQDERARFAMKAITGPNKHKEFMAIVHRRANWKTEPWEIIGNIYESPELLSPTN